MASLDVHLVTPEREVWSGPAQMVVAHGIEGDVGILTGHTPMLIRLAVAPLRIQHEDGHWEAPVVDGGFLHVTTGEESTRVDVLASGAELEAEIDRDAARARVSELEARLQQEDDDAVRDELDRARARAGSSD
ncbi:MAG: ATP synthase F1 subunit epsilon [Actinomycetota bacterium]